MKSVLVIGAGVVGLCSAWHLAEAGYDVAVVDRDSGDDERCSTGNSGMVVPSHFVPLAAPGMVFYGLRQLFRADSPFGIRFSLDPDLAKWAARFILAATPERASLAAPLLRDLNRASRDLYAEWAGDWKDSFGYSQGGLFVLCQSQRALDEEAHAVETARAIGVQARVVTPSEILAIDPQAGAQARGGVFFEEDAHLDPSAFLRILRRKLEGRVEFSWGEEISGFTMANGRVLAAKSDRRTHRADEFVLAPGAWAGNLGKKLGLHLPMLAGKGYSITIPAVQEPPKVCALWPEFRLAMTPLGAGVRFGGTMELGGLDRSINEERVEGIRSHAAKTYPGFGHLADELPVWCGLRPCTPDGLPYLGKPRTLANVTVAAGHAMMGMSLGPVTGRLVEQIVAGESPDIGLSLLHPDRYA